VAQPKCKPVKGRKGLWEIRSNISSKRIARILFCIHDSEMVLLHGFVKKSQKTLEKDLNLAMSRMKEVKKND